ncbi:unnamed protein product [Cercopithifilaria johnstoni]|uniref:Uncharacterized protein n=1 Tax=Cercopithifilaria johnstoni TaxID=2874296 RepID=A0A8J2M0S4_9BILA|nr:unnamed protein product [Cercopithifilaria johnstoni]
MDHPIISNGSLTDEMRTTESYARRDGLSINSEKGDRHAGNMPQDRQTLMDRSAERNTAQIVRGAYQEVYCVAPALAAVAAIFNVPLVNTIRNLSVIVQLPSHPAIDSSP